MPELQGTEIQGSPLAPHKQLSRSNWLVVFLFGAYGAIVTEKWLSCPNAEMGKRRPLARYTVHNPVDPVWLGECCIILLIIAAVKPISKTRRSWTLNRIQNSIVTEMYVHPSLFFYFHSQFHLAHAQLFVQR